MFKTKIEDWYDLHSGYMLALDPGVTVLVGPNGAGKSTLLNQIKEAGKEQNAIILSHDNLRDGGNTATQRYQSEGNITGFATAMTASEGEFVSFNFGGFLPRIKPAMQKALNAQKPLLVLIDGVDSGASVDRQREISHVLGLIEKDCAGHDFYVVVSTNSYELAKGRCLNPRTGEKVSFASYEEYAGFICEFFEKYKKKSKCKQSKKDDKKTE